LRLEVGQGLRVLLVPQPLVLVEHDVAVEDPLVRAAGRHGRGGRGQARLGRGGGHGCGGYPDAGGGSDAPPSARCPRLRPGSSEAKVRTGPGPVRRVSNRTVTRPSPAPHTQPSPWSTWWTSAPGGHGRATVNASMSAASSVVGAAAGSPAAGASTAGSADPVPGSPVALSAPNRSSW